MKYKFIKEHKRMCRVAMMCAVLGVSRSAYYGWLKGSECRRAGEDEGLLLEIRAAHQASRQTYGSPRIHAELKARGITCGHNRVARLMRLEGLRAKQKRRFKAATNANHDLPVAANLLDRDFQPQAPNRTWAADISYIPTAEGWLYLAVVMDLYSRLVVGWAMSDRPTRKLTMDALGMALGRRRPGPGLLHHSDRGSQYASGDYQAMLQANGITCSMSRKGEVYDNAPMESFFHTLKNELVHHRRYHSRQQARTDIFEYVEVFYNRQRRHSYLGYHSPAAFEAMPKAA
jgi:transposase InsO family protein